MANVEHSSIADPNIHEPKGVATAAAGKVYIANGSGSGTWDFAKPPGTATAASGQVYVANGTGGGAYAFPAAASPSYGEMYIQGGSTATVITTVNTLTKVSSGFVAGPLSDMTFTTDHLNVVTSAKYLLEANITLFGVAATTIVWEFDFMLGAAAMGRKMSVTTTGTEKVNVGLSIVTGLLSAGDQIGLGVYNATDANDPTIVHASVIARKL